MRGLAYRSVMEPPTARRPSWLRERWNSIFTSNASKINPRLLVSLQAPVTTQNLDQDIAPKPCKMAKENVVSRSNNRARSRSASRWHPCLVPWLFGRGVKAHRKVATVIMHFSMADGKEVQPSNFRRVSIPMSDSKRPCCAHRWRHFFAHED